MNTRLKNSVILYGIPPELGLDVGSPIILNRGDISAERSFQDAFLSMVFFLDGISVTLAEGEEVGDIDVGTGGVRDNGE